LCCVEVLGENGHGKRAGLGEPAGKGKCWEVPFCLGSTLLPLAHSSLAQSQSMLALPVVSALVRGACADTSCLSMAAYLLHDASLPVAVKAAPACGNLQYAMIESGTPVQFWHVRQTAVTVIDASKVIRHRLLIRRHEFIDVLHIGPNHGQRIHRRACMIATEHKRDGVTGLP